MHHQTFEPSSDLALFVKCYWTLDSPKEKTPSRNTIVPDGCMKLIFHYGDKYNHYNEMGKCITLPKCFLIGQLTKPYQVEPVGKTGTFFVCFRPNGFLPFATTPIKEMENTAIPLKKLFGTEGSIVEKDILTAKTTEERIKRIELFLLNQLTDMANVDQIVESTVETIFTGNGHLSIDELSKQHSINRRQLVRKFSSSIGLSPKQLSKTIKLQATLKSLLHNDVGSLTNLAYQHEYYDQAHFIKDFKEFTGLTPKEFYGENLKMSLIFDQKD